MKASALSAMADVFIGEKLGKNFASFSIKSLQRKITDSNSTNAVKFSSATHNDTLLTGAAAARMSIRSLLPLTRFDYVAANFTKGESYEFGNIS